LARVFDYTFSVRLSSEDRARLQQLLRRFGKWPRSTNSVDFRELIRRLSSELTFETRFDNPGFDSLDEETQTEEQGDAEGPDPEVVLRE
jgi:hypothetical protein